jgi:hypothetical protein
MVGACGTAAPTPPSTASPGASTIPSTPASAAPSVGDAPALLIEVTSEGGFINPAASIGALPTVAVDTDGRIYTPAGPPADGTSPLVPAVDVRDVGAAGAGRILDAFRAAGLDHEGSGGIAADTGSVVFTVVIDGTEIVSRFARGGGPGGPGEPGGPGMPGASGGNGGNASAAFDLLSRLIDPTEAWGNATAAPATPYVPLGYRVYDAPTDVQAGTPVAWPLTEALDAFGVPSVPDFGVAGLRSGIVVGADAGRLATALAQAQSGTEFSSAGRTYTLWVRPMLPDELGG